MSPNDYALDVKTRFGDTPTADGRLIRDLDDRELVQKMITKYPSERYKIQGIDEYLTPDEKKLLPPESKEDKKTEGFLSRVSEALGTRWEAQKAALGKSIEGEQTLGSGFLQAAGQAAGAIGDVGFEAVKSITPQPVQDVIGGAVETVAGTAPVQAGVEAYQGFKEENPELAGNIEAVGNLATVIPGVGAAGKGTQLGIKGVKDVTETVVDTTKKSLATRSLASDVKNAQKQFDETIEITSPVLDKKGTINAFEKAGQPGGAVERGRMGTYTTAPDQKAIEIASDTVGLVSKKQGPIENIANLNKEISRVSESEMLPFLQQNGQIYNPLQLQTYLKQLPKPLSLKANAESARAYDLVINTALQIAKKYKPDSEGLWRARAEIDDMIEREFGDAAFDSPTGTGARKAALAVRNGINDFIGESVGGADIDLVNQVNDFIREARKRGIEIDDPMAVRKQMAESGVQGRFSLDMPDSEFNKAFWKAKLKQLSNIYTARENIAEQSWRLMGKNSLERWMRENPGKADLLKKGLGVVGLGLVGTAGVNLLTE